MIALLALGVTALAVEPTTVMSRLDESTVFRKMRITPGVPDIPSSDYEKAAAGKVVTGLVSVDGYKAKKAYGLAIVDVPIERFWAAINDDPSKVEYTKLDYTEILSGGHCAPARMVFQYLPVPLMTDRWWVSNMSTNGPLQAASQGRIREMSWQTTDPRSLKSETAREWAEKGIPVGFSKGGWLLIDIDGTHTFVEYNAWSDPGGSVPVGLANSFASGGIKDTFETMTQLAKDGPGCPIQ